MPIAALSRLIELVECHGCGVIRHSVRRTSAGWTLVAARAGPAASRLAITMAIGTSRITARSASGGT